MKAERRGEEVALILTPGDARYLLKVARETILGIDLDHSRSAAEGYEELEREAVQASQFFGQLARQLEAVLDAQEDGENRGRR